MNIEYGNNLDSSLVFYWGDPFAYKTTTEAEMRLQNRNENDPEQAPRPERGDRYILACALAGIIIVGATGAFVGYHFFGIIGGIYGLFGGIILGGVVGSFIGSAIKNRLKKKRLTNHSS
jgi:predicted lipid-binding transport protein (Tim44 family)